MKTEFIRNRSGFAHFWDFDRCPIWYRPIAFGWRWAARAVCWFTSRHAVERGSSISLAHERLWWDQCACGYFGAKREFPVSTIGSDQ